MRPDILLVGFTTDDLHDKKSAVMKNHGAKREVTLLEDMLGSQKVTKLGLGHVSDESYHEKCKAKLQRQTSLSQIHEKEIHRERHKQGEGGTCPSSS